MNFPARLMITRPCGMVAVACAAVVLVQASHLRADSAAPWEKPRELSSFGALLSHSPFSLPTAEESSPLSDRYAITGITTFGGVEQIFVFDRTDQSRHVLTHTPDTNNMSLVALVREGDLAPQKATIRVGSDIGTIAFLEATPQQPTLPFPGSPIFMNRPGMRLPQFPQQGGFMGSGPSPGFLSPSHRIIRRPMVIPPQIQPPR